MRVATAFKTMMLAVVVSSSLALLVAGSETAPSGAVTLMIAFLSAITGGIWPKKEKHHVRERLFSEQTWKSVDHTHLGSCVHPAFERLWRKEA